MVYDLCYAYDMNNILGYKTNRLSRLLTNTVCKYGKKNFEKEGRGLIFAGTCTFRIQQNLKFWYITGNIPILYLDFTVMCWCFFYEIHMYI